MGKAALGGDRVKLRRHFLCPADRHKAVSFDHLRRHHRGHRDEAVAVSRDNFRQRRILELRHDARFHRSASKPFFQVAPEAAILGRQQRRSAVEVPRETALEFLGQPRHRAKRDFGRS